MVEGVELQKILSNGGKLPNGIDVLRFPDIDALKGRVSDLERKLLRLKLMTEPSESENISVLQDRAHQIAKSKGWWDKDRSVHEVLMLVVTEVSEACEEARVRDIHENYMEGEKPCGFGSELADVVIRVMDLAEFCNINLFEHIDRKLKYNATREHRHGGKSA